MKWVVILVAIQLVVVVLQMHRLSVLEERVEAMELVPVNEQHVPSGDRLKEEPAQAPVRVTAALDEQLLRRIVRSELLAFENSISPPESEQERLKQTVDPVENAYRLDSIREELTYHIEQGEISEEDMMNLQSEIVRLDPDSRTMVLRELVSALNSGELKGQL